MKVSEFDDLDLTSAEKEDILILIDTAIRYPENTAQLIAASGIQPSADPEENVYKLILAKQRDSRSFDAALTNLVDENREFLGGIGLALGKAAGAVAGLFKGKKRKKDGTKGFIGRMFDKLKDRRRRKKAEREAAASGKSVNGDEEWASEDGDYYEELDEVGVTKKRKSRKGTSEDLEKAKKSIKILTGVSIGLGVALVGVSIWAFSR